MDNSKKLYVKAINFFSSGYMDKAMKICERSISENLKNASSINLKGLLYYLKGDLENAQALWKMNYQLNKDNVSKRYLEDSSGDDERRILYLEALKLIKELRLNEAVKLLEKCGESDFNYINVSNYLAFCYIKQGEYGKAVECINNTLSMDKKDKDALRYRKLLIEFGLIKNSRLKKAAAISAALVLVFVLCIGIRYGLTKGKSSFYADNAGNTNTKTAALDEKKQTEKEETKKDNTAKREDKKEDSVKNVDVKSETVKQEVFPYNEVASNIAGKKFDGLYSDIINWKDKNLAANDKAAVDKGVALLKEEGIEYFNKMALQYMSEKDYNNALAYFTKAYNFSQDTYLHSHIIYMLGSTNEKLGNIDKAIEYYKDYDKNNSKGDYEDTVLYQLAMIFRTKDISASKVFAQKLAANFTESIYNNSNIKEILSK